MTRFASFRDSSEGRDGVVYEVRVGHPFVELTSCVQELNADLLVLGRRGLSEGEHTVGTIATKCVRKTPSMVALIHDKSPVMLHRIAACVDFSETSAKALRLAAEMADAEGAALHVLHVHYPSWLHPTHVLYDLSQFPDEEHRQEYERVLNMEMDTLVKPIQADYPNLKIETDCIEHANPAYGIANHLRENAIDLAVLGTRGRTGLKALLMGTTAEHLLHEAPCSVLTVKPEDFS